MTDTPERYTDQEIKHLESELHLTLEEIARLQNALADANMRILANQNRASNPDDLDSSAAEVFNAFMSELEQPLTTINGYCDLLLGESVGMLGALQRKFIERIKNTISSTHQMMDEFLNTNLLSTPQEKFFIQPVEISSVIDSALTTTIEIIRQKKITLLLDLPETLPTLRSNRDILRRIVMNLIMNAAQATQVNGKMTILARSNATSLLILFHDGGPGIIVKEVNEWLKNKTPLSSNAAAGLGDKPEKLLETLKMVESHAGTLLAIESSDLGGILEVSLPLGKP
jgi:signal transduction histidine kinase